MQRGDAIAHVIIGNKFRVLARDEQKVAESLRLQFLRLAQHFFNRKRDAQNRVVTREAAVGTIVDALVGKIQRRKEAMVLPKRCCVSACARRQAFPKIRPAAGEISAAKSASETLLLPSASRAVVALVATDFLTSSSSGSELNSATKLTKAI